MNLKKIGKIFTSKSVGTGPSPYEKKKRIYRAAVSQRLRETLFYAMERVPVSTVQETGGPQTARTLSKRKNPYSEKIKPRFLGQPTRGTVTIFTELLRFHNWPIRMQN